MNAVSGGILSVLLVAVCFASRRWALLAIMAGVFFLTQGHAVEIFGLNMWSIRFLEAAAFARVIFRGELLWSRLNKIDGTLLLLYNYSGLVWILRSSDISPHLFASGLDPTLCYLALRGLLVDIDDLRWLVTTFVVLLVPYTAVVGVEHWTGRPAFAIVGETGPILFRNGIPRCTGTFRHGILLGSVAASFLPLYAGIWLGGPRRAAGCVGGCLCLALVVLSNSGGPVVATGAAVSGWLFWLCRDRMCLVRRTIVLILLFLMVFMKAPIWYLPAKVSRIVGGGGYHRSLLMDRAWGDLHKWWLTGLDRKETIAWIPYYDEYIGGADITNQYLSFGLKGGLPAIAMFVAVLSLAFAALGRALATTRRCGARPDELLLWGVGVSLFVHVVSWFSIAYFDQSWVVWLMHIAALSASVQAIGASVHEREAAVAAGGAPLRLWARRPGTAWRRSTPQEVRSVSAGGGTRWRKS